MDLGFTRFDILRAEAVPAPLDYLTLIASLAAAQAGSPTAMVEATLAAGTFDETDFAGALARLLGEEAGWVFAALALHGSFNPHVAVRGPGTGP